MLLSKRTENYHLWVIKILLYIIPFLSLYISKSIFFPYITGKNFAFRIIVELAALLWLALVMIRNKYRPGNSIILFSILIFTFVVGLADMAGINPYNSFWSNYERMEGYITVLHLALYFIICKSIFKTRSDWSVILNLFVITGAVTALYSIALPVTHSPQYVIEYGSRVSGTIGNPPFLASYLLLIVSIGMILLVREKNPLLRAYYLLTVFLDLSAIYLTASRGAILAFAIGVAVLIAFYLFKKPEKSSDMILKKTAVAVLVLLVVSAVFIFLFRGEDLIRYNSVLSRFASISSDAAVETRFRLWKMAWEGFKTRPILGWGQENFLSLYTLIPIPFNEEQAWVDRAHNIIIDWLVNAGLLGLLSYLAVFAAAVFAVSEAIRKRIIQKEEASVIFIALIVYFIQNLFTFDTVNTYLAFFTLLAYIDSLDGTYGLTSSVFNPGKERGRVIYTGAIFILILSFVLIAYFVNYKPIRQLQITKQSSIILPEDETYVDLLDDFKRALSYRTFGDTYVRRQMSSVANYLYINRVIEQEGALTFISSASEELHRGISRNRGNLMYLSWVIHFFRNIAVYEPAFIEKTEALIMACIRLNPEYQWLYMTLSDIYMLKKDYEGAYAVVKQTVTTDPENDLLQVKFALAAILTERDEEAAGAKENVENIRASRNSMIFAKKEPVFSLGELYYFAWAYREMEEYATVLKYYRDMIKREPLNAKFHYEISEVYLLLGDKMNAAREGEMAVELAPGLYGKERLLNNQPNNQPKP